MDEKRAPGASRRSNPDGGRRQTDTSSHDSGSPHRFSARVLWHLPDNTRCWVMEHKGRLLVRVSRESRDLRIEVVDSQAEATAQADAWCLEYGAVQVG
jgi:hypothetical protein